MIAWLHNPELARRGQKLGELLRFQTTIERHPAELAIIIVGRHWTSHHEWTAHKRMALDAGLNPAIMDAVDARSTPVLSTDWECAVYEVSTTLLSTARVPRDLYDGEIAALSEQGMVEQVGIIDYYCPISL